MTEQLSLFDSRSSMAPEGATAHLRVRVSMRARRLALRMVPPHTLEVVVPRGTRPANVQAFVAEHRLWIERARREIATCHRGGGERSADSRRARGSRPRVERALSAIERGARGVRSDRQRARSA